MVNGLCSQVDHLYGGSPLLADEPRQNFGNALLNMLIGYLYVLRTKQIKHAKYSTIDTRTSCHGGATARPKWVGEKSTINNGPSSHSSHSHETLNCNLEDKEASPKKALLSITS
jgi:hypothetical protein